MSDRSLDVVRLLSDSAVLTDLLPGVTSAEPHGHPGGIVALRHADETSVVGFGLADLEHATPIGPHTVFDCASVAKQFTAAALLVLRAREKVGLDDRLLSHLPELGDTYAGVTLRHLLFHTSGIRDYQPLLALAGARRSDYFGVADVLGLLGRQRSLAHPCGTRHMYSNSNYFLLAQVIERASGARFGSFLDEAVLRPAGLSDTRLRDNQAAVVPGRARSYAWRDGQGYRLEHTPTDIVGDSGLLSTVDDLLAWTDYLRAELDRAGSPLAEMARPGALDNGEPLSYGCGLYFEDWAGSPGYGHGGSYDGFRSDVVVLPDRDLVAVAVANWVGADTARVVAGLLEATCARLDAATAAPDGRRSTAPSWPRVLIDGTGLPWELRAGGDDRVLLLSPEVQAFLDVESPDLLTGRYQQNRVTVSRGGEEFTVTVGASETSLRPSDADPPTGQRLAGLAGTYRSDELMTRAAVSVSETGIRWRRRAAAESLEWVVGDVFRAGGTWVVFRRGPDGDATELEVLTPRASGLVFRREDQPSF